jgi:hypothetical protein
MHTQVKPSDAGLYIPFVGKLAQTYADESAMTNGKIDISKMRPLLFDMASVKYWRLGPAAGKCWNVGKSLKQ